MKLFSCCLLIVHLVTIANCGSLQGPARLSESVYDAARNYIVKVEDGILTGGNIQLTDKEIQADNIIKTLKQQEFEDGLNNPSTYAPGMHFFHAKSIIEASPIYKILRTMPKGSILHGHNSAMVSSDWVVKNLTYWPDLMRCVNPQGIDILAFRKADWHGCTAYVNVVEDRIAYGDTDAYDTELKSLIDLYTPQPEIDYPFIDDVWNRFQNIFTTTGDFFTYLPAYKAYHRQLLEEMFEDGVSRIEFRTSFSAIYDEAGVQYNKSQSAAVMKQIIDEFVASHPTFLGVKTIYSPQRKATPDSIKYSMDVFKTLNAQYPDFIMGFDLVGQEDLGQPLSSFLPQLRDLPTGAQYFFHAGETNWYGTSVDENLIDAFLLGATRLGHGYAITKHPVIMTAVKERGVCVEVSPISNQVLHLVQDLRNHPAAVFTANDIPFVISNDDPGYWNAKGLSYDFYYAFMSFAPEGAGLTYLKQLVYSSIQCSVLTDVEREATIALFNNQWGTFIDGVIAGTF